MGRKIPSNAIGGLVALAAAAGCLGATPLAAPPERLTEFQWALASRGALFLIPVNGFLYPARLAAAGEIETQPVRVSVTLYETGQKMTPVLQSVVSPFEVDAARWVAQKRIDKEWVDAGAFVFARGQFFLMESASAFMAADPAVLRFAPVKQP